MFQRCSIKQVRRSNRKLVATQVVVRNSNSLGHLDSRVSNNEPNNNNNYSNSNNNEYDNDRSCKTSSRLVRSKSISTSEPVGIEQAIVSQAIAVRRDESPATSSPESGERQTLVLLGRATANGEKDALATAKSWVRCDVNDAKSTCNGDKPDGCSTMPTPLDVTCSSSAMVGVSRQMPTEVHLASSASGLSLKSKCTNPFLVDNDDNDDDENEVEGSRRALSVEQCAPIELETMENDCEPRKRRGGRRRNAKDAEMQPMLLAKCSPNGLAANGECDKSLLLLNEMEEPISLPVFFGAPPPTSSSSSFACHVDRDDNTDDDDCTTMSVDFLHTNDDWMTNANHKSCTSLVQTSAPHWPPNDLGRAGSRSDAKGAKLRMAAVAAHCGGPRLRQSQRTSSSENVPTSQAQAFNDVNRPRRVPKYPDRLLVGGDLDVMPSGYVRRGEQPKTINGIPTLPFQRQDYSRPEEYSDEVAETPSISSKPLRKELFNFVTREKSLMPNIKKLNIAYPNKTHALVSPNVSLDDDEKCNDKSTFKKSLLKIGHKCGLRISRSPEKKKTDALTNGLSHHPKGLGTTTARYPSYQSAVDLSQNLPQLDIFLEDNFDRIAHTKGTQSIGKASTRKRKHGHKRTKSCSKNMGTAQLLEYTNVQMDSSDSGGPVFHENSPDHNNYFMMDAEKEQARYELNHSNFLRQSHGHLDFRHQQTPSSSDSFGTYNSKKSKMAAKLISKVPFSGATEPLLVNSNTTSSSLSSSDYASVYSPSTTFTPPEQPFVDVYPQHHPPKSIEISPKHRRIKARPPNELMYIDSGAEHHHIPTNERSCYQFENQLPYHEDYLSHYHNQIVKSAVMASSLPNEYPTSSSSNGSYYHLAHHRPSFSGTRGNNSADSNQALPPSASSHSSHSAQSYASASAAHRVIVSQSKKLTGEVVLEYEC